MLVLQFSIGVVRIISLFMCILLPLSMSISSTSTLKSDILHSFDAKPTRYTSHEENTNDPRLCANTNGIFSSAEHFIV